eukprot:TRINITY_DN3095_c0_g2_i1.p1 TRINITY_DN3095_c0_g2~~TRINITY_DN3095_c0_g2_i1.p1  ORF type:complete len:117 (+),score=3.58 TRINITY_DN3095_c0_g2_i1:214-564(+)
MVIRSVVNYFKSNLFTINSLAAQLLDKPKMFCILIKTSFASVDEEAFLFQFYFNAATPLFRSPRTEGASGASDRDRRSRGCAKRGCARQRHHPPLFLFFNYIFLNIETFRDQSTLN